MVIFVPDDPSECIAGGNPFTDWLHPCSVVSDTVQSAIADSMFAPVVADIRAGVGDAVKTASTFWIKLPEPDVGNSTTGVPSDVVGFLQSSLAPLVAVLMVFALMLGMIRTMYDNRYNGFVESMWLVLRYIAFGVMVVPIVAGSLIVAHDFANWILEKSTIGTSFVDNLFSLFDSESGVASAILLAIVLAIGALLALFQAGLMIARGAALLALVGSIMLSVAVSNSETGMQALKTSIGWIAAWIAYPVAAAIVYAAGFRLMGTNTDLEGNGLMQCLYGIVLMIMAIFALPALLRLTAPLTGAASSGRGAGGMLGGLAASMVLRKVV